MPYTNVHFYYLSGTGNTLTAIRNLSEQLNAKDIQTTATEIDRFDKIERPAVDASTLIAFCYPTHGFSLPWLMLKFILKFPVLKNTDVMLMNTRAGAKYIRWYGPGLSGIAQILPLIILFFKRFHIRYLVPLDPPSNWISIHPGFSKKWIEGVWNHTQRFIDKTAQRISEGKKYYRPNVFWMMPVDLAVSPISMAYMLFGRFFLAKTFIAGADCNNCRICEMKCPAQAIKIKNNRPYWTFSCESCMRCINICPSKSIQASHSLIMIFLTIFTIIPVSLWIDWMIRKYSAIQGIKMLRHIDFIISWLISLFVVYFLYLLLFYLMQLRWVNLFFEYTSLTKFWRRYMSPGVGAKDFIKK
jgi:Pyruvate/2-oxoacid:ferredoxin oxidoreductase delta subunit